MPPDAPSTPAAPRARAGGPASSPRPDAPWKAALAALSEPSPEPATGGAELGLLFELRELIPRSRSRWNGPSAKTATPRSLAAGGGDAATMRLAVRPVIRSTTGNWVQGTVAWGTVGFQVNRLELRTEQLRWFTQFAALHRATREPYSGQESDWIYLDDFHSPLLWQLLAQAPSIGIALVSGKKHTEVTIGSEAQVGLDASDDGDELRLSGRLRVDDRRHPAETAAAIGDHGVYAWQFDGRPRFTLAPTTTPLTPEQHAVLGRRAAVAVPARERDEFLRDYYPRLRRRIEVTSADASVRLPAPLAPRLVLTATFTPMIGRPGTVNEGETDTTLHLHWDWEIDGMREPLEVDADPTLRARVGDLVHELAAELRGDGSGGLGPTTLSGADAAEFAHRVIPALERVPGIRVEIVGDRPDYRELTGVPKLTLRTVATHKRDWFDLGVEVRVEGRIVPFSQLFTALSKGHTKLKLIDNSYLSLKLPVFDELRRLIAEATELPEWETGIPISRYQASLWSEFEDLADETEQAQAWRSAVSGLLDMDGVAHTPQPNGVEATLRPYQQHGFDWLAFLWRQGLGGILADDMGLGKTLQALTLIAHAVESGSLGTPGGARPFLVVAPTSVVPNWLAEAGRFTPGLTAKAITSTRTKSRRPLAEEIAGADIVVTSYALFRLDFEAYRAQDWAGLILDEAQFVKNRASKVHRCAVDLDVPFTLALTGTPMENSLMDLWSLFAIVAPGLFPSSRRFAEQYVRPIASGADPLLTAKLRRRIRPLMLRRTKQLVAAELPAKQEQVLRVDLAPRHRTLYDTVLQKERQKLLGLVDDLDRNRFIVFRSLTLLRMLSLDASLIDEHHADMPSAKLDALVEQLTDVAALGHRALVFSQFTSFLGRAADRLDAAGIEHDYLDGSTRRRAEVIESFRSGEAPVFLISLKAGGFGLNLTEADYVFLLDPWWNPASEAQAVDRTHRIGQTRSVNVYRMVATDTIEEKVMALRDSKAKLFDAVMDDDGVFSAALTADDIRQLLA